MEKVPERPRQGDIWWSAAPPIDKRSNDEARRAPTGVTDDQLREWLSCTAGWKALELTWGAIQSCEVSAQQLKPLLQAAMAEAARLGAPRLVVRQLDVDEVVGRCLALALSGFPNFTTLKLRELNLYDEALAHLAGALHSAEHLHSLALDSVWASEGGWATIAAALKVNCSLRTLKLRYILSPGSPALTALCAALADPRGSGLETLRLGHNTLGDQGTAELCRALDRGGSVSSTVGGGGADVSGGSGGGTLGAVPGRVAHVDLSYNGSGAACVPGIAGMLRALRSLRTLDLSYNPLGQEGARDLCRAVSYAPHLTCLRLASTGADDAAVEALVRAMTPTTFATAATALTTVATVASGGGGGGGGGLATLSLAHNRITARGAALLAAAAKRPAGCVLADVDLSGNALIGEQGAKAWAEALSSPGGGSRLRRLVLSGCEVPDEGAYALGAALKTNTCLRELGLAENHLSTSGLALLAEVIKVNSTLRLLDVSLNMVGPQGMEPFSRMSHLRGHITFSKANDHTVQRVSSCLVKAELLREYRLVEAVKKTSLAAGVWAAAATTPEGVAAAAAATAASRAAWGANDYLTTGDGDNPFLDDFPLPPAAASHGDGGGAANPFLSPAASYINPFLDGPAGSVPGAAAANPFLDGPPGGRGGGGGGGQDNPFLSPRRAAGGERAGRGGHHDNPFLSPRDAASEASDGTEGAAAPAGGRSAEAAGAAEGRQLATRVVTRLGSRRNGNSASGACSQDGELGGGEDGGNGDGDGRSGSGTGVYVSSRSTADEGDLVTDLDLKLVDYLMEHLGFTDPANPWGREDNHSAPGPEPSGQSSLPPPRPAAVEDAGPSCSGVQDAAVAWEGRVQGPGLPSDGDNRDGDDDLIVEPLYGIDGRHGAGGSGRFEGIGKRSDSNSRHGGDLKADGKLPIEAAGAARRMRAEAGAGDAEASGGSVREQSLAEAGAGEQTDVFEPNNPLQAVEVAQGPLNSVQGGGDGACPANPFEVPSAGEEDNPFL